jgi:hypothetical protein
MGDVHHVDAGHHPEQLAGQMGMMPKALLNQLS